MSVMPDWDGQAYVLLERLLFDIDDVIRRHVGLSKLPAEALPQRTAVAVTLSWGLCFDAARVLYNEKQRLEAAKVVYDQR